MPNEQLRQVGFELVSGGWRPQRVWCGVPRCRWVFEHVVNDAATSEYLPFTTHMAGTTSQPRMRNSAKLVSSLRQGVGGLSEVGSAGQGASGSLDMC